MNKLQKTTTRGSSRPFPKKQTKDFLKEILDLLKLLKKIFLLGKARDVVEISAKSNCKKNGFLTESYS